MMRNLLIALCSLLLVMPAAAQDVASVYYENWTNNSWQPYMQYQYTYDENYLLINSLMQMYDTQDGGWTNSSQTNYTNNSNGTIYDYISQLWDDQNNTWTNSQRATYSYNGSDQPSLVIYEGWNSGTWQNSMKYSYTYDGNNYLIKIAIYNWDQPNNTWKNLAQYLYTNNDDGTIHDYLFQTYSSANWTNSSRGTYTYSASQKLLTSLIENWSVNTWVNSIQQFNTYDGNDFLVHNILNMWDQASNSWKNYSQINYENNEDGTINQYISQNWDDASGSWINSTKANYSYFPAAQIQEISGPDFSVYPNPAGQFICIDRENAIKGRLTVKDINGKVVLSTDLIETHSRIEISYLLPGTYLICLETEGLVGVKQVIKN